MNWQRRARFLLVVSFHYIFRCITISFCRVFTFILVTLQGFLSVLHLDCTPCHLFSAYSGRFYLQQFIFTKCMNHLSITPLFINNITAPSNEFQTNKQMKSHSISPVGKRYNVIFILFERQFFNGFFWKSLWQKRSPSTSPLWGIQCQKSAHIYILHRIF